MAMIITMTDLEIMTRGIHKIRIATSATNWSVCAIHEKRMSK